MQFTQLLAILAGVSAVTAVPAMLKRQAPAVFTCPSGSPECCATDVLGVADLNCNPPPTTPTDMANFTAICAAIGQQAKCCDLPILGQALICTDP